MTLLTYAPDDVILQLETLTAQTPKRFKMLPIAEKERLIQRGKAHYADFIQPEAPPSELQMAIYHEYLARYRHKIAQGIIALSDYIFRQPETQKQPQIVLLSLIRAGLPLGVLLKRHLAKQHPTHHYGISIIKDKGLDRAALETILARHPQAAIYCIDGWIGKGAITTNLRQSWQQLAPTPPAIYPITAPTAATGSSPSAYSAAPSQALSRAAYTKPIPSNTRFIITTKSPSITPPRPHRSTTSLPKWSKFCRKPFCPI